MSEEVLAFRRLGYFVAFLVSQSSSIHVRLWLLEERGAALNGGCNLRSKPRFEARLDQSLSIYDARTERGYLGEERERASEAQHQLPLPLDSIVLVSQRKNDCPVRLPSAIFTY